MPSKDLHPDLSPDERRRLFEQGVELFNQGEFFECHEAFEEIWRSTTPEPRDLFQGLIQVAVGLFHFHVRHRPDVARRVLIKGRRRLEHIVELGEDTQGVDLERFLREVAVWEEWLVSADGEPPVDPQIFIQAFRSRPRPGASLTGP